MFAKYAFWTVLLAPFGLDFLATVLFHAAIATAPLQPEAVLWLGRFHAYDTNWLISSGFALVALSTWKGAFSKCSHFAQFSTLLLAGSLFVYSIVTIVEIESTVHPDKLFDSVNTERYYKSSYTYTYPWILAEFGNTRAQIRMAEHDSQAPLIGDEDKQALYWLRKAAGGGSLEAQRYLYRALIDIADRQGISKSASTLRKEAVRWATEAANQRDFIAETDLGCIYAIGIGVTKNIETATYWFNRGLKHVQPHPDQFVASICGVAP